MKHLDKLIPMAMGLALLTSCADNDMPFFGVTDPGTNAQYAYLNEYKFGAIQSTLIVL